ncbi:MAG: division/cell wall cluster transcriptional repressor MraZ [Candidatus Pacebacteria bacterium]|nr:division/cell wall cluster transcriptional repressor MraZ [Candidatus Paceibacterota bacterium]
MLIGEFTHAIDQKNRTSLPAKFKGEMGDRIVITKGIENCLSAYTMDSWQKLTKKLSGLSITKPNERKFKRNLLSGAEEVSIDKQGRVLIPSNLCQYAGIKGGDKLVWAGVGDNAEIWSEDKWIYYLENSESSEELAESLEGVI